MRECVTTTGSGTIDNDGVRSEPPHSVPVPGARQAQGASLVRYLLVGAANSLLGYLAIFAAMFAGIGHVGANAIGYGAGLLLGFVLNRAWSFRSRAPVARSLPRYLLVIVVAYLANLASVVIAVDALGANPYVGQMAGLLPYVTVGYLGSRYFAFAGASRDG